MVNKPRNKGTAAETAVVNYFMAHGWAYVERRQLKGSKDRGDVTGMPGLAVEVKVADAGFRLGVWIAETDIERLNAGADHGILVMKPSGMGVAKVSQWPAVMTNEDFNRLWLKALTAPEFAIAVVNEPPANYSEKHLRWQLYARIKLLEDPREVVALTLRPPGTKDNPDGWYRVMTLEHITRLLHAAGYGDSDDDRDQLGATASG